MIVMRRMSGMMFALTVATAGFAAQAPPAATVKAGLDGIFDAFVSRPLVGLGDRHNLAQGHHFYEALIRDPRFARDVRNVVVEFGTAQHQEIVDRYVNGEFIPYPRLRRVWMDTPGFIPTVDGAYFAHFFYQVRQTNAALPADQRIKVWLGAPPVDWSSITTREQLVAIPNRDRYTADILLEQILAKNRRALVIYGAYHFEPPDPAETAVLERWSRVDPRAAASVSRSLQKIVEEKVPDSFFVVQIYTGFGDSACMANAERSFDGWQRNSLATPLLGTPLEAELRKCLPTRQPRAGGTRPPAWPEFVWEYMRAQVDDHVIFRADALLYLGNSAELTFAPRLPDIYLDEEYRNEISRRYKLMTGQDLSGEVGRNLPESMKFTQRDHEDGTSR
jgi:hypothetical protein